MKISNLEILIFLLISKYQVLCFSLENENLLIKNDIINQNEINDEKYDSNLENSNNFLERKELNFYFWFFFLIFLLHF